MLVVSTRPGSWHGPKRVRMLVASTRQRSWPSRAEPKNKNATRDFEDRTFPCHSDMGRQTCLRVSGTTSRHSRHGNRSNTAQRGSMNLLLSEFEYRSNSEFEALVGSSMTQLSEAVVGVCTSVGQWLPWLPCAHVRIWRLPSFKGKGDCRCVGGRVEGPHNAKMVVQQVVMVGWWWTAVV